MFNLHLNDRFSDIICYVGENKRNAVKFPTHKCVLELVSPVFAAMLKDGEFEWSELLLTDVTPTAFNALLHYAYTGRLTSYVIAELSDILFTAEKYQIKNLIFACLTHLLENDVNTDNFWPLYIIAQHHFNELMPTDMIFRNREFLIRNTTEVLQSADFENLTYPCVYAIVDSGFLNPKTELDVWKFVVDWSLVECRKRELYVTPFNQRRVLGDIIHRIRYFLMTRNELRNGPFKSNILTIEECELLFGEHGNEDAELPHPWNSRLLSSPRSRTPINCWEFPLRSEFKDVDEQIRPSILVTSSTNCIFNSVELLVHPQSHKIDILCQVRDLHGEVFREWNFASTVCNTEIQIKIEKPICLKAFKCYQFNFHCTKGTFSSKRFENGIWRRKCDEKVLFLKNCRDEKEIPGEYKSEDYWKKVFAVDFSVMGRFKEDLPELTCINKITIERV